MEEAAKERQKRLVALRGFGKVESGSVPTENNIIVTVEEKAEQLLKEPLTLAGPMEITSLSDLAPKKANWDLKRDLQNKLEVLEEQTQQAIMGLVKKRIHPDELK